MKLSIIVPVYNVAEYLPKCLESLLAQRLSSCEILLVDDGSTDGISGELCDACAAEHPDYVRVFHKPNGGLGDARNFGLQEAKGDYVLFVDSDDYIAPETVTYLWPYMADDYDVIIFGFTVDSNGVLGQPQIDALPSGTTMTLSGKPELLLAAPNAWNKAWKRSLFMENDIRFPARAWYEDLSTTGKLLAAAKEMVAIPRSFYYYVVREGSITRNSNLERNLEIIDAVESVRTWYRDHGIEEEFAVELEALAVFHMYMTASVRVLRQDPKSPVLDQLREYLYREFPDWRSNPYVEAYPPRHRLILLLLRLRRYGLIKRLFTVKN